MTIILHLLDLVVAVAHLQQVWDKLLKSRRGCLEKLHPGESLKPRDFPKANPRAQPRVCLRKILRHSGSSEGEVFQTIPRLFNSLSDFGFLEVQGQTCPRALYGKSSRKLQ